MPFEQSERAVYLFFSHADLLVPIEILSILLAKEDIDE